MLCATVANVAAPETNPCFADPVPMARAVDQAARLTPTLKTDSSLLSAIKPGFQTNPANGRFNGHRGHSDNHPARMPLYHQNRETGASVVVVKVSRSRLDGATWSSRRRARDHVDNTHKRETCGSLLRFRSSKKV
jgi:hypothetical protein